MSEMWNSLTSGVVLCYLGVAGVPQCWACCSAVRVLRVAKVPANTITRRGIQSTFLTTNGIGLSTRIRRRIGIVYRRCCSVQCGSSFCYVRWPFRWGGFAVDRAWPAALVSPCQLTHCSHVVRGLRCNGWQHRRGELSNKFFFLLVRIVNTRDVNVSFATVKVSSPVERGTLVDHLASRRVQ
jgi:hypothetical protein